MRRIGKQAGLLLLLAALIVGGAGGEPAAHSQQGKAAEKAPDLKGALAVLQDGTTVFQSGSIQYSALSLVFPNKDKFQPFCKKWENASNGVYPFSTFAPPRKVSFGSLEDMQFMDVFVDSTKLAAVQKEVEDAGGWWDVETTIIPPPPVVATPSRAKPREGLKPIVDPGGGIGGMTGENVIVAVLDTGIDFRHPDFVRLDGQSKASRILYYWDTLRQPPDAGPGTAEWAPANYPPNSAGKREPIGTVYTRKELTDDLNGVKKIVGRDGKDLDGDFDSHGTACAGIATGNGSSAKPYAGVAPKADIIAVRISETGTIVNQFLLNKICAWLVEKADKEKKPLAVSCSFGGPYGAHDGNLIQELQLSERFTPDTAGRAICIAAGNEGALKMHAEVAVPANAKQSLTWNAPGNATLELFTDAAFDRDVTVTFGADAKVVNGYRWPQNKITSTYRWRIIVGPGKGEVTFAAAAKPVRLTAYMANGEFQNNFVSTNKVDTPGTTRNAITVGSYEWNDVFDRLGKQLHWTYNEKAGADLNGKPVVVVGQLSPYSNFGQSGPANPKPEIVAPGRWYTAPTPKNPVYKVQTDATGKAVIVTEEQLVANGAYLRATNTDYARMDGTSAATPYAAGAVALLMQLDPKITVGQIKDLLKTKHTTDEFTGRDLPNADWGYGKLDRDAVIRMIDAVRKPIPKP